MPGSTRVKAFLLKREITYGNDATPAAATNAILLRNTKISPINAEMVSREIDSAAMGHMEDIAVGTEMVVEGEVEFAGSGTAGTAPAWGTLLRTCGFAEVVTAGTDVAYNPISENFESATGYYFYAGKKHVLLGARGDCGFTLNAKGIPVIKYKIMGLYGGITDDALPSGIDLVGWQKPLAVNKANTPIATLFGATLGFYDFELQRANTLVHRNLPGLEDFVITDRAPTGSITVPDPTLATIDFFTKLKNADLGTLNIVHGTVAGKKVGISSAYTQITSVDYDEKDKACALKLGLKFSHSAVGNDDFIVKSL